MERRPQETSLATPADAEIILRLYELRRESVMRQARAWVIGQFWPTTVEEYFAVAMNFDDPHNAFVRQVTSYWEMAAAMVLHGAVSPELFVDCNNEGFLLLAKFAPILDDIRQRLPGFLLKTSELIKRVPSAAARYDIALKNAEGIRARRSEQSTGNPQYAFPAKS